MKKTLTLLLLSITTFLFAQSPGLYNTAQNKTGEELKLALHNIVTNHINFSYNESKYLLYYIQEDPDNSSNYLQFYTNRSIVKGTAYGNGGDYSNREHVWAASHGDFRDINPMDGDLHNLHAADGSVNGTRSNYDFDEVDNGTYIDEADAYYSSSNNAFEPSDRDKGAVARTLFYMATRYEGENGELDFEMADYTGTSPNPTHGKLSTLLQWNRDFPPSDYERTRNDRVEMSQGNRNPFVDHPEYADMIWNNAGTSNTAITLYPLSPLFPEADNLVTFSIEISSILTVAQTVTLYWGSSYNSEDNEVAFTGSSPMIAEMSLAGFKANDQVFFKIVCSEGTEQHGQFLVNTSALDKMSINTAQGTGDASSVSGVVTIDGVVTSNVDNVFTMQTSTDIRSGITVYSYFRGKIGDSISVTGNVVEFNNLTEMTNVTSVKNYGAAVPQAVIELTIDQITEDYEGMLVKIKNVYFVDGGDTYPDGSVFPYPNNYVVTDGSNDINFYVRHYSIFCNTLIPSGTVDVTGVVGQYGSDYQIVSQDTSWIDQVEDVSAPAVVEVSTEVRDNTYSWIIIKFNEIVTEESVEDVNNYSFDGGIEIGRAYYYETSPNTAKLLVKNIEIKDYKLTIANIQDFVGNTMSSTVIDFTSSVSTDIHSDVVSFDCLFPNPVDAGLLNFSTSYNISSVEVYSLQGRKVLEVQGESFLNNTLDVSSLNNGNYILKAITENSVIMDTFSVLKR